MADEISTRRRRSAALTKLCNVLGADSATLAALRGDPDALELEFYELLAKRWTADTETTDASATEPIPQLTQAEGGIGDGYRADGSIS